MSNVITPSEPCFARLSEAQGWIYTTLDGTHGLRPWTVDNAPEWGVTLDLPEGRVQGRYFVQVKVPNSEGTAVWIWVNVTEQVKIKAASKLLVSAVAIDVAIKLVANDVAHVIAATGAKFNDGSAAEKRALILIEALTEYVHAINVEAK